MRIQLSKLSCEVRHRSAIDEWCTSRTRRRYSADGECRSVNRFLGFCETYRETSIVKLFFILWCELVKSERLQGLSRVWKSSRFSREFALESSRIHAGLLFQREFFSKRYKFRNYDQSARDKCVCRQRRRVSRSSQLYGDQVAMHRSHGESIIFIVRERHYSPVTHLARKLSYSARRASVSPYSVIFLRRYYHYRACKTD